MRSILPTVLIFTPLFVIGGAFVLLVEALQGLGSLQGAEVRSTGPPPTEFEVKVSAWIERAFSWAARAADSPVRGAERAGSMGAFLAFLTINGVLWSLGLWAVVGGFVKTLKSVLKLSKR